VISELRPYQLEALADIRDSLRGGVRRLMVQAATGAGKTKIAAAMVESALSKGNRMAFVVPAVSLIDQSIEAFWAEGIRDVGVIQANHTMEDWSKPVQVCSIQTIQSRGVFPQANAVIFDEAHRLHEAHKRWMGDAAWANVPIVGLSATPWARGLGKHFESLLIAATTSELIEQGYLSPFKVFATGHPDLSGVKTVAGDYHESQLSDAMQAGELTADIVKTWREKWGQGKTLCFAVDKAHARSIQERFEQIGVSCGYQDASTTPDERRELRRKFHSGEFQVVVNIQTLTTGVDWDVRCLILARPTKARCCSCKSLGGRCAKPRGRTMR
jgi:DNA repair protein RadD